MNQSFDHYGQPELPYIILCNPSKEELYSLGLAFDIKMTLRFNALGEFVFNFPQSIDGGQTIIEAYSYIQNKRLVRIEGYGYFLIVNAVENLNGAVPIMNVSCQALESELISKKVTTYAGTRPLYDLLNPEGTILGDMISLAPNWEVDYVDAELLTKFRTFNVSDSNVYSFLMNDVSKAFECVFSYNSENRSISAYTIENATVDTDIFLSFDNIIKSATFAEKSDEITTALSVYGGGTLNIRSVNPLGTNYIYDFSYYANSNWMSQELVDSINSWSALVISKQPAYADLLVLLKGYQAELLILRATLATYMEEYLALEGVKIVRIQQSLPYTDITIQLNSKRVQITSQNIQITNKNTQITNTNTLLAAINTEVNFENNFSPTLLLELNNFIYENTYKNENIIQTDSMTAVEVQDEAQSLYDQAVNVLDRISQPRYEVGLEAANYISLPEYAIFTEQTELGSLITAEIKDGEYIETVLLEITMQFDNPENFSMIYSNRLRLDGEDFKYSDLVGQVVKTGAAVAFDSSKWSDWEENYKDEVSTFITSALDATLNNIVSNTNQEILIDQNGIRGRRFNGTGFDPTQVWLTNSVLAFSDNAFETAKVALGKVTVGSNTFFGLVADVLVGRILAGTSLTITNSSNTFTLNELGATLTNATFNITNTNSRIFLDPVNGLKIQQNVGGTWTDRFFVSASGNVTFSGNLTGATGTFSGAINATTGNIGTLIIDANGLKTLTGGNFLKGNGDLKWGALSIVGGTATFSGNIFANNLQGQVVDSQVSSGLNAGKITNGSMSGNRLFGGTPSLNGITSLGSSLQVSGSVAATGSLFGDTLFVEDAHLNSNLYLSGALIVSGGSGIGLSLFVSTPSGTRQLIFSRGVLVDIN